MKYKIRNTDFEDDRGRRRIIFNEKWISNGHWMVRRDCIKGKLATATDAEIEKKLVRASRKKKYVEADLWQKFDMKTMEKVIPKPTYKFTDTKVERWISAEDRSKGLLHVYTYEHKGKTEEVYFDSRYIFMLGTPETMVGSIDKYGGACVKHPEDEYVLMSRKK